jgi:hypothetical protein
MKNLHLISTEKYSPLAYSTNGGGDLFKSEHYFPMGDSYKNIYIINDEEIKVGDWIFDGTKRIEIAKFNHNDLKRDWKKIILTTDGDLINDGVQEIDDDFLKWFVKNSSCEKVEVANDLKYFNVDELRERHLKGLPHLYSESIGYKIIIPQEEPKQLNLEEDETVKSDWDLRKFFEQMRFDKNHHLGLGDIRLTIAQQEEICELVERFYRCH